MAGTFESEYVQKDCDVKRCMRVGRQCDTVIASLLPQYFSKVDRLEGDGDVGTVKLTYLNPGMYVHRDHCSCILSLFLLAATLSRSDSCLFVS